MNIKHKTIGFLTIGIMVSSLIGFNSFAKNNNIKNIKNKTAINQSLLIQAKPINQNINQTQSDVKVLSRNYSESDLQEYIKKNASKYDKSDSTKILNDFMHDHHTDHLTVKFQCTVKK